MPGFATPGLLFAGNSSAPERRFLGEVLAGLRKNGYTRLVEPCAGAFAGSLVAAGAGWKPDQIEASDVTLFSSVAGGMLAGNDLSLLGVTLDAQPVELPDADVATQAAFLLWVQLRARLEAKPDVPYWHNLVTDLAGRAIEHQAAIRKKLTQMQQRIGGLAYQPLDMWEHLTRAAADPKTVIYVNPPTYSAGFEKFFDTGGRLAWHEPRYDVFDPATGPQRLMDLMDGLPAMLIMIHETETGQAAHPRPVFARPGAAGRTGYVLSNRPGEIFGITGGPKVSVRDPGDVGPADFPILPVDHDLAPDMHVAMFPVKAATANYYRDLWMHRLTAEPYPGNLLVTVDGYVAAVIGYSIDNMARPLAQDERVNRSVMLRYAAGAPHAALRTGRLAAMLALQQPTAELAAGPAGSLFVAASRGVVTVNFTRFTEAKQQRGLMKRINKTPHEDGWKLTYYAPWQHKAPGEVLAEFLKREAQWRNSRKS